MKVEEKLFYETILTKITQYNIYDLARQCSFPIDKIISVLDQQEFRKNDLALKYNFLSQVRNIFIETLFDFEKRNDPKFEESKEAAPETDYS